MARRSDGPTAPGFPKAKYASVEYERRWLCAEAPAPDGSGETLEIIDLYFPGTQLRLRETFDSEGSRQLAKLTKKADAGAADTRLITTIYLSDAELALFAAAEGARLRKKRYPVRDAGRRVAVDVFHAPLEGLVLAEIEFGSEAEMKAAAAPSFALREVTADIRYSGAALAKLAAGDNVALDALIGPIGAA